MPDEATMGSVIKTGNRVHDTVLLSAEATRQSSITAGASMAAVKSADIAFARAALSSCLTNNSGAGAAQFTSMLKELGVNA
jgi:hypothetical protein